MNNEIDIFAEILSGEKPKETNKTVSEGVVEDKLKDITVTSDNVQEIIEGKKISVTAKNHKPQRSREELVSELNDLVKKTKNLVQEMTTCGMIGVGPGKKKAKKKAKKKS